MKKFNKGDRVIYVGTLSPERLGKIGSFNSYKVHSGMCLVDWDDDQTPHGIYPSSISLIPSEPKVTKRTPKVGDYIKRTNWPTYYKVGLVTPPEVYLEMGGVLVSFNIDNGWLFEVFEPKCEDPNISPLAEKDKRIKELETAVNSLETGIQLCAKQEGKYRERIKGLETELTESQDRITHWVKKYNDLNSKVIGARNLLKD